MLFAVCQRYELTKRQWKEDKLMRLETSHIFSIGSTGFLLKSIKDENGGKSVFVLKVKATVVNNWN